MSFVQLSQQIVLIGPIKSQWLALALASATCIPGMFLQFSTHTPSIILPCLWPGGFMLQQSYLCLRASIYSPCIFYNLSNLPVFWTSAAAHCRVRQFIFCERYLFSTCLLVSSDPWFLYCKKERHHS